MTHRWKPILSVLGILCLSGSQARSQPPPSPSPPLETQSVEDLSRSTMAGAAVTAGDGSVRITATLAQTAIGLVTGSRHSAGQGFWYGLARTDASDHEGSTTADRSDNAMEVFPNPLSESAQISFRVSQNGPISLIMYDLVGKPVQVLLDEEKTAGTFTLSLDGKDLSSGSYTIVLTEGNSRHTIPLQVVK